MSSDGKYLDLPIPEGQREVWAQQLAVELQTTTTGKQIRHFVFRVGAEWFGIEPKVLTLTLPDTRPSQIPHQPSGLVEGLINADGRIVVCIRMPRVWDIMPSQNPSGQNRRVLVLNIEGWTFAIRADEVLGMEDFLEEEIQPLPQGTQDALRRCGHGIALHKSRAVTLLNATHFAGEVRKKLR